MLQVFQKYSPYLHGVMYSIAGSASCYVLYDILIHLNRKYYNSYYNNNTLFITVFGFMTGFIRGYTGKNMYQLLKYN